MVAIEQTPPQQAVPSPALFDRIVLAQRLVGEPFIPASAHHALDRVWQNNDLDLVDGDLSHPLWWLIGPVAYDLFGEDHEFDRKARRSMPKNSVVVIPPYFLALKDCIQSELENLGVIVNLRQRLFTIRFVGLLYGGYPWFESYLRACDHYGQIGETCHILDVRSDSKDVVTLLNQYKMQRRGDLADCLRISCSDLPYPGLIRGFHTPSHIENIRHLRATQEA
jgi:hypothetical protein